MTRIQLIDPANTSANRAAVLAQIQAAFGATPNMFKAVANSPAALGAMWGAFGALGKGTIGARLGEQIAVAVAEENGCDYCLAAHTALGQGAGLTAQQLAAAQAGQSTDPKVAAALDFALTLVRQRGQVSEADVAALRRAGYGDEQIVEILAHVALNIFTNYVNVAFDVPLDFTAVPLLKAA
ncbi:MAG: peroxidase-related enzyme [Pseudomonadota bacterium]